MKKILAVLGVIVAAAAPLGGALPAYAASVYDSVFNTSGSFEISDQNSGNITNVTNYEYYITGVCSTNITDEYFSSKNSQNGYDIAITQIVNNSSSDKSKILSIFIAAKPHSYELRTRTVGSSKTFSFYNVSTSNFTTPALNIYLYVNTSGQVVCSKQGNTVYAYNGSTTQQGLAIFSTFNIIYPSGYEGITLPDSYDPPAEPLHLKPEWTYISSAQWQGRFMDTNVSTYDGISEFYTVCDDDLAPIIIGNITNGQGWTENFSISATAQVNVTLPESTNAQTFTITGRYDCGGFGPDFDTDGVYTFDISQYGTVNNPFLENCINMDLIGQLNPDGLDIPQCIENIQNIIGLLSFGQIKLNKNFENIDSIQCRNLQVIGGWMFKPGAYICPQIPAEIRNIITPFVLLALGYLAANFLRKRNESI